MKDDQVHHKVRYGTKLHTQIIEAIRARILKSEGTYSTVIERFNTMEERFEAYVPESAIQKARKAGVERGKEDYVQVHIPYTYAMIMTAHTYLSAVLLSRSPIFQFAGRHGETEHQTKGLEAVIDYQVTRSRALVPMYLWLYDALKYNVGALGHYYTQDYSYVSQLVEKQETWMGMDIGKPKTIKQMQRVKKYEGTKVHPIRPHDLILDPGVPIWNAQEGEFLGRRFPVSLLELKTGGSEGRYINIEVVDKKIKERAAGQTQRDAGSRVAEVPNISGNVSVEHDDITGNPMLDGVELSVKIIPKDWGLGESTFPEKWVFTIIDDDVVVGAQPCGYHHDRFNIEIIQSELNSHNVVNRSMSETIQPLEDVMNWLFNSHFYNVRKVLNDTIVYDPSRISSHDLHKEGPGKLIRLLPEAYGTNAREAIHQMQIQDITRSHLTDINIIEQVLQRVSGINDGIMGVARSKGRKTATESRADNNFSISRQKTIAEYISAQGFYDLGQVFVKNTQQFYSDEMEFRIAGNLGQGANKYTKVGPDTIAGEFDFVTVDGTLPIDKFAMMNTWRELLGMFKMVPQLAQEYDVSKILGHIMFLGGVKDSSQFKLQVSDTDSLLDQARRGDMVPTSQVEGAVQKAGEGYGTEGARTAYAGRGGEGDAGTAQPSQVSGLGPVA